MILSALSQRRSERRTLTICFTKLQAGGQISPSGGSMPARLFTKMPMNTPTTRPTNSPRKNTLPRRALLAVAAVPALLLAGWGLTTGRGFLRRLGRRRLPLTEPC